MDQNIDRIVGEHVRSIWGALLVERPPGHLDYDRIVVQFDDFALECGWTEEVEVTTRLLDGQYDRSRVDGCVWTEILSAEELTREHNRVAFSWKAVNQSGYDDLILVALEPRARIAASELFAMS